jgi:hypothetical protein
VRERAPPSDGALHESSSAYLPKFLKRWLNFSTRPAESVAGLLAASGIVGVVYGLIRTEFLTASSFPGPIFGILGVPILGLAAGEAVGAIRDRKNQDCP